MDPNQNAQKQAQMTMAYHDHKKGLNARAFFKLHDHAMGEDLVQNTFIKTWKYLIAKGEVNMMKAFLYHILNNLIVDEYRKHQTIPLDALIEKGFQPSTDDLGRLFNVLDGKSALLLISRLPEKFQKIITMRYVRDMSLQEISRITGQSKGAVAVQAHRGLKKLKILYNANKTLHAP